MYARVRLRGVPDHREAEDLTQEVFVRVLARIGAADSSGPIVREYLVQAAEHLVTDRRRRLARRGGDDSTDAMPEDAESAPSAEDAVVAASDQQAVLAALARLPELQRRVLRLRIVDELSAEAVGAIVGRTAAAVRQIQHRAVIQLRQMLEEQG